MSTRRLVSILTVILLSAGLAMAKDSLDQKREKTRKMANQTLKTCTSCGQRQKVQSKRVPGMRYSTIWEQTCCC